MLSLSEVKSVLRKHNIHASKRLGQNFLIDKNLKDKIINSVFLSPLRGEGQGEGSMIIEIGPGLGALTLDLCKKSDRVIAIEKDKRLYGILKSIVDEQPIDGSLELVNQDILKYDIKTINRKITVIGNIPYNISSPILNHLINNKDYIDTIYVTVQKEFADRITAIPGTKDYGALSCYVQFYGETEQLFNIPRGVFFPVPEVDSAFVKIKFIDRTDLKADNSLVFKLIRSAFGKRRKTILNGLYASGIFASKEEARTILQEAGISENTRPEVIPLIKYILLANKITNKL